MAPRLIRGNAMKMNKTIRIIGDSAIVVPLLLLALLTFLTLDWRLVIFQYLGWKMDAVGFDACILLSKNDKVRKFS